MRAFLTAMGMKCRKVGRVPSKADPDEQAAYKVDKLEPRLAEAQAGQRAVFFEPHPPYTPRFDEAELI